MEAETWDGVFNSTLTERVTTWLILLNISQQIQLNSQSNALACIEYRSKECWRHKDGKHILNSQKLVAM